MTVSSRGTSFSDGLGLAVIFILLLRPNTNVQFVDRAIDLVLFGLCFILLCMEGFRVTGRSLATLVSLTGLTVVSMVLTIVVNMVAGYSFSVRDMFEFYRPVFTILLVLVGARMSKQYGMRYARAIAVVLVIQAALMWLQLRNVGGINGSPLSWIYSMEKAATNTGRTVGTYANPNVLGFVINMAAFTLLLRFLSRSRKILRMLPAVLAHAYLLVMCSSRTSIAAAGIMYVFMFVSFYRRRPELRRQLALLGAVLAAGALVLVVRAATLLVRYRYVMRTVADLSFGGLLSLPSISVRLEHFRAMLADIRGYLLGNGPRKAEFRVGDNDYLFSLYQWGIAGVVQKYTFYIYVLAKIQKAARESWFVDATRYAVLMLFVFGLTGESFYTYKYLAIVLVNVGFCLSMGAAADRAGRPLEAQPALTAGA